jgi:hypothetical protein
MNNVIAILLIVAITGCKGQEKEKKEVSKDEKQEMAQEPKGQWEVHKEYDDLGNLIKYDSIYTYAYSNIKGDSIKINLDSIMDSFRGYFEDRMSFDWKRDFSYFPKTDSLFMKDFFKEDYFLNNWQEHHSDIENMMKKMDSVRNAFLRKHHPGLIHEKE